MASIRSRKAKDGTLTHRVLYRHTVAGTTTQASQTFDDLRAAKVFKNLVETIGPDDAVKIIDDSGYDTETHTLTSWCNHYIDHLTGVQEGTRDRYRSYVKKDLGPLAHLPLPAVNRLGISKWVNALEKQGASGKTIANKHGFLSGALKDAALSGQIDANPCEGTKIPKTLRREMVFLTQAEFFKQFLPLIPEAARELVLAMPTTGTRWSEITALQVKHFDPEARSLRIAQSWKWADGNTLVLGVPKTKKSIRNIGLPGVAYEIIASLCEGRKADDFIFVNPRTGKPWTKSTFQTRVWQPAAKQYEELTGKRPRVHDMRHTCAAWMMSDGVPLPVIQRHLGHESIQTTVDVYGHLEPAAMLKAAMALDYVLPASLNFKSITP